MDNFWKSKQTSVLLLSVHTTNCLIQAQTRAILAYKEQPKSKLPNTCNVTKTCASNEIIDTLTNKCKLCKVGSEPDNTYNLCIPCKENFFYNDQTKMCHQCKKDTTNTGTSNINCTITNTECRKENKKVLSKDKCEICPDGFELSPTENSCISCKKG